MINLASRIVLNNQIARSLSLVTKFRTIDSKNKVSNTFTFSQSNLQTIHTDSQDKNPQKSSDLTIQKPAESSKYNYSQEKLTIHISQTSSLGNIIKKKRTTKQKILAAKFRFEWTICWFVGFFLAFSGHMYFPESFLSTNLYYWTEYDIVRDAQKQILSGKYGKPKIPIKN